MGMCPSVFLVLMKWRGDMRSFFETVVVGVVVWNLVALTFFVWLVIVSVL